MISIKHSVLPSSNQESMYWIAGFDVRMFP
jgi:hypothetical protein